MTRVTCGELASMPTGRRRNGCQAADLPLCLFSPRVLLPLSAFPGCPPASSLLISFLQLSFSSCVLVMPCNPLQGTESLPVTSALPKPLNEFIFHRELPTPVLVLEHPSLSCGLTTAAPVSAPSPCLVPGSFLLTKPGPTARSLLLLHCSFPPTICVQSLLSSLLNLKIFPLLPPFLSPSLPHPLCPCPAHFTSCPGPAPVLKAAPCHDQHLPSVLISWLVSSPSPGGAAKCFP